METTLAGVPIAYWIGFHAVIFILIACDLVALNRGARAARTRGHLVFVLFLFALAALFAVGLAHIRGGQTGLEFASGYLIELSLSIDNLFVFLVMFRAFGLGPTQQRKVLLFGILGAMVMRGLFIFAGIALLNRFVWIQYAFGALLLIAAVRLMREGEPAEPGQRPAGAAGKQRAARPAKWIAPLIRSAGSNPARLLIFAIVAVEIVDLVFALDSIPAVLAVTREPFVAYTSNIFAILGLRSLYFLLASLLDRLRFLHFGLAAILGFVGCKMILARWIHVPVTVSLGVILLLAAIATAASLLYPAPLARPQEKEQ